MDVLTLHLDRSVIPGLRGVAVTQRWEHLADEFKVPDEIKRKCENFKESQMSPSEAMFEYLCTTRDSLTIETLKSYLKKLGRNDVVLELERNNDLKGTSHWFILHSCSLLFMPLSYPKCV